MIVKATKTTDFYKGIVNIFLKDPLCAPSEKFDGAVYSYLRGAWRQYQMLAMAALDLGFGVELARRYLAESAGTYVELQKRTGKSSSPEMLVTLFRIGTCGDRASAKAFAKGYLGTAEGERGGVSARMMAATPAPDDHWWQLANALALFHAESSKLGLAIEEVASLPPRKGFARSAEWWKAIVPLAVHCLTAAEPNPVRQLADVAEINQKMFGRDDKDFFYEAWFAEIAMAFASAAAGRGWVIPTGAVHASMPLELLALPAIRVPEHRWGELLPIDQALAKGIERAAKGGQKTNKKGRRS